MTQAEHPTSLAALRSRYGVRYRWLLLLAVMVGTMASIMSSTIVNVAIPGMSQHFALGQERAQWVTSGFMVAMTVSMLTTPWLLARYGYRHTYVACMALLLAGGVVGGFATRFDLVLAARVAEGLAAGIVPSSGIVTGESARTSSSIASNSSSARSISSISSTERRCGVELSSASTIGRASRKRRL